VSETADIGRGDFLRAVRTVAGHRPVLTVGIIVLSAGAALLSGVGVGFIVPIVELAQSDGAAGEAGGITGLFVTAYEVIGVPLTLETAILGVGAVMTVRYTASFLVAWFRAALQTYYVRDLQTQAFDNALDARVSYFDREGSDDILNAIVTQTFYAGRVIQRGVRLIEQGVLSLVYLSIALVISPTLTVVTVVALGGATYLLRSIVEPAYDIGGEIADANERRQEAEQGGNKENGYLVS
jgi:subfamily B ATP-binding cassette protein MsbA